ncbi:hypothetical protein ABE61_04245 [Lysinibacillus sphaericus]|uniref:phage head closure protein n=1 Tax=Lysinibacillus sphaericus TaxID=1421 RepID=UPI0018CDF421|nr:phage head closure protein [Lysinibacillus sphaericus]MBG9453309.1 hypothetical protein [Lysinibacillus sphaericus]MBG9477087.1 hypothetical protein [Lysinibacillus sphaericus]MBG9591169.1 hypothetical protein [Lysinibacillus sphaericus]MBG9592013.1 hypothetical protein [Lysinibacillus sphaericus]
MNPAQFDKRVLLRKRFLTTDDLLQEIEAFTDYGTYWAMVKTMKASEVITSGQEQTAKQIRFVLRYSKGLNTFIESEKTSFQIVYSGTIYDVKSAINDDEANLTITIIAEGRV